ncbi:MAG: NAD-dependent epimerase/dehydratase family protein [Acidobacteriaceae bacterium]
MKVLLAGASGAIGQALVRQLKAAGETVIGLARSPEAARALAAAGAESVLADALDAEAVKDALMQVRPDAVINELTALPKRYTPQEMKAAAPHDREVRLNGNANLLAATGAAGVRRYILESSGFWYEAGTGLADEGVQFAFDASPGIAASARTYAELEAAAFSHAPLQVVALRYGFFYGPGTWYTREGDMGDQVRQRKVPIIGGGRGVSNWVHIEDAASATVAALHGAPGVYNIVDDDTSEQRIWLPAFALYAGAAAPRRVWRVLGQPSAGAEVVYYATRLRGASNAKAKRELNFRPRPLEWLSTASAGAPFFAP